MNKIISINISNIAYHLDEDAYYMLKNYLSDMSNNFHNNYEKTEVMKDIEHRVSELLSARISNNYQVINKSIIYEVINIIGQPSQMNDSYRNNNYNHSNNTKYSYRNNYEERPLKMELFRDIKNKKIGGVCAGIARYLDIEVSVVRIITFILLFSGVPFILYFVAMFILPKSSDLYQDGRTYDEIFSKFYSNNKNKNQENTIKNELVKFKKSFDELWK